MPLSLVGTFGVMYLLGYSLNNLTLMALTISTGFVVDDAIVMIENIARYIEEGESPLEAALKGSEQIGFTIVSLTRLADRRADPAALHGRHRRPALPRVRRHAQRDDPGLGRRLADADADDVREAAAATRRPPSRAGFYRASGARLRVASSRSTAGRCGGCCGIRRRRCSSPSATLVADGPALRRRPEGLLSRCRTPA